MIIRAAIIIIVGIIQVVVGAIILLKSAGSMTHVGSGLISEGISDIIFGASGGDWVIPNAQMQIKKFFRLCKYRVFSCAKGGVYVSPVSPVFHTCCIFQPLFGCCALQTLVKICNFNVFNGKKSKKHNTQQFTN